MSTGDMPDQPRMSTIQALYFELIRTIDYNQLDGARMIEDLLRWRDLWHSVIADRQPMPRVDTPSRDQYETYPPLSLLRNARYVDWAADTLYMWTDAERLPRLRRLIEEHWEGCAISEIEQGDIAAVFARTVRDDDDVLELWWD